MPNDYLDQVQVGGTTYDLQDAAAQEDLSQLKSHIEQTDGFIGFYPPKSITVDIVSGYITATMDFPAAADDTVKIHISGTAFTTMSCALYLYLGEPATRTYYDSVPVGSDFEIELEQKLSKIEIYSGSFTPGTATITAQIASLTGLAKRVTDSENKFEEIDRDLGIYSKSIETQYTSGYISNELDIAIKATENFTVKPYGTAFVSDLCNVYVRYSGDSENTNIGQYPVGVESSVAISRERDIVKVTTYMPSGQAGYSGLAVRIKGQSDEIAKNLQSIENLDAFVRVLKGKKCNYLGDSITYGSGESTAHPFTYYLAQNYDCTCRNYGIAGSTLVNDSERNPMCIRYTDMDNDAEIVSCMGGTNDYWNDKPLGVMGDTQNTTIYGALDALISGMITKYPSSFFYMVTPPHGYAEGYTEEAKPHSGSLEDVVDAVKEVAAKYSVPVLDIFHAGGLYAKNSAQNTLYYADGVHLSTAGQQKLAQLHAAFIMSHYR